jgi:isocitrate lyase
MPATRDERQWNASNNTSTPPAPDAALYPPTTRSGLVRQIPVTATVQDEDDVGERDVQAMESEQRSEQPQSEFQ